MARRISSADASATGPSTSSVAGLTLSNVRLDELAVDEHPHLVLTSRHQPPSLPQVSRQAET
jgi:hypothetical protein